MLRAVLLIMMQMRMTMGTTVTTTMIAFRSQLHEEPLLQLCRERWSLHLLCSESDGNSEPDEGERKPVLVVYRREHASGKVEDAVSDAAKVAELRYQAQVVRLVMLVAHHEARP